MDVKNENTESRIDLPSQKKVDFNLNATIKQDFYEYRRKVKRGKYPNPFDPDKKPSHSVLKDCSPTPINPFFKKAFKINYWTPAVSTVQLIEQMVEEQMTDEEVEDVADNNECDT